MGNTARTALAALAGAAAVTAGAVAFAGASAAAGPAPAPAVQAGQATCVIDSGGYCTVSHGLGEVPEAIVVSPITPDAADGYLLSTVQDSATATTFRVRAMATQDTPKTSGRIRFSYAAYAAASVPGTPTPPVTSRTPTSDLPTPTSTPGTSPTPTSNYPTPGTSLEPTPPFPTSAPSSR
ncbi:hypothetical protein [Amycolatopsis sp. NPDC051716]|jgi:hypothetical protein|uniref:hypothetical protein n=1 Tax=Amycolatopsis sp. NPDC051716 TaxID=3155804 RepID=UPI00344848D3